MKIVSVMEQRAEAIRACSEAGMTRAEAADRLGISYLYLVVIANKFAIPFKRAPGSGRGNRTPERDAEIVRRFESGETLSAIGVDLGITRERARQIVETSGVASAHERVRKRQGEIAAAIAAGGFPKKVAEQFGVAIDIVYQAARYHRIALPRKPLKDESLLAELSDRVRNGESIHSASGQDQAIAERLRRYCIKHGIKSRHKSRNPKYAAAIALDPRAQ